SRSRTPCAPPLQERCPATPTGFQLVDRRRVGTRRPPRVLQTPPIRWRSATRPTGIVRAQGAADVPDLDQVRGDVAGAHHLGAARQPRRALDLGRADAL